MSKKVVFLYYYSKALRNEFALALCYITVSIWELFAVHLFDLSLSKMISAFQFVGLSSTDLIINSATIGINSLLALLLVLVVRKLDKGTTARFDLSWAHGVTSWGEKNLIQAEVKT